MCKATLRNAHKLLEIPLPLSSSSVEDAIPSLRLPLSTLQIDSMSSPLASICKKGQQHPPLVHWIIIMLLFTSNVAYSYKTALWLMFDDGCGQHFMLNYTF